MKHISEVLGSLMPDLERRAKDGTRRGLNCTHGMTGSPEYSSWSSMVNRCTYSGNVAFDRYGGAGIGVCERWRLSFGDFYADMGPRPTGTSIERIDGSKGYEPGNCRWATRREQAINRRSTVMISANGETLCMADWARKTGIPEDTLRNRITKFGWSHERAVNTPQRKWGAYDAANRRDPVRPSRANKGAYRHG